MSLLTPSRFRVSLFINLQQQQLTQFLKGELEMFSRSLEERNHYSRIGKTSGNEIYRCSQYHISRLH